jgi:hypothetical protein
MDIHKQTTKIAYPAAGLKLFGASVVYSPFKHVTSLKSQISDIWSTTLVKGKSHICHAVCNVLRGGKFLVLGSAYPQKLSAPEEDTGFSCQGCDYF